jgi:hypothetical protein
MMPVGRMGPRCDRCGSRPADREGLCSTNRSAANETNRKDEMSDVGQLDMTKHRRLMADMYPWLSGEYEILRAKYDQLMKPRCSDCQGHGVDSKVYVTDTTYSCSLGHSWTETHR